MHPSNHIRATKDTTLKDHTIVLGVTGSIAAVETVKLVRELIRHGGTVIPVMSRSATEIIHPYALEFASGTKPVTTLTGAVEHVEHCGLHEGHADLLLIAPSTANTISKIACGIDDTPVTTFATTALGTGIGVLIAPAMHAAMYQHDIVTVNIDKLEKHGVQFIAPRMAEKKAKFPGVETVVAYTERMLASHPLRDQRVLIIGGATMEPIDDMRVLTNRSSGRTAVCLATKAFTAGAEVELWYGHSHTEVPPYLETRRFTTVASLATLLDEAAGQFDIVICCAAISDYTVDKNAGKIPSGKASWELTLLPTPKIIERVRERWPRCFLVGYKAESKISIEQLLKCASHRRAAIPADLMVANLLGDVSLDANRVFIVDAEDNEPVTGDKCAIAQRVLDRIGQQFADR